MIFSTDSQRPIRVLVSDMSPLIASGVEAALASGASFELVRGSLDELLAGDLDGRAPFDVVVIDGEAGLRLAGERRSHAARASVRALRIFTIYNGSGEREIRQALEAGIHGCATLSLGLHELQQGVRTVAQGLRYVCPRSAQRLADCMSREPLTPREAEVLAQLARGSCNKTIALELAMALGTVKAHVKSLMSKLDAKTRTQVVSVAIARGLVEPSMQADAGVRGVDRATPRVHRASEFACGVA